MPEQIEPIVETLEIETSTLTYSLDETEVVVTVTKPPEKLYYRVDKVTNRFLHATRAQGEFSSDSADMYLYGEYSTSGPNNMLTYYLLGKFIFNIDSEEFTELVTRVIISVDKNEQGDLTLNTSLRPKAITPPEPAEYIAPDPALAEAE